MKNDNTINIFKKLLNKHLWSGEKICYYPSFTQVLIDSFRFSVLWTVGITVLLCIIPLIIYLRDGERVSLGVISVGLSFLLFIFIISNGMFLYDNWYKQNIIINKSKKILPEGCDILSIEYNHTSKEYLIKIDYFGRIFRVTVEYPFFYISEKGVRALGALNIGSVKTIAENKLLVKNYMG